MQVKIINNCTRWGSSHKINQYPAFGAECYKCKKKNHFEKMCRLKHVKEDHEAQDSARSGDMLSRRVIIK